MTSPLHALVAARGVAILDGGLATSLEALGHDLRDPLWSARILVDAPEEITRVHVADLRSGADIVTTASYQASLPGLRARGLDEPTALELFRRAVALAREATRTVPGGSGALVAASIGSYGAYLADGSEYRGHYAIDDDALAAFHRTRLHALAEHADLVACETIPCIREARVLAALLAERAGPPAWVSFSATGDAHTAQGEPIEDAAHALAASPRVVGIGVNCIAPAHAEGLVARIAAVTDRLVVVYPNSGERYAPHDSPGGWCGAASSPDAFAALAQRWYVAGARVIGGCCRTGPAHIAALARWRADLATRGATH